MKKLVIILISIILCTTAKASNCESRIFQEEKINLALCSNYGRIGERGYLLFKARTKVLNDYIKEKIARGELADKKFEIQISDPIYIQNMELTQGKNGYFVAMTGFFYPTLQELITIVDYFAKPDWQPFIPDFSSQKDDETYEIYEKRYNATHQKVSNLFKSNPDKEPFAYQPFTVWEKDGVSLIYSGDGLQYAINGTPVPFKVNSTLPVKIEDRYLFFEEGYIHVVQNMETIKTFKIDETHLKNYTGEDYTVYVHPKWANICHWSNEESWFYSYSYDKNRFYGNEK